METVSLGSEDGKSGDWGSRAVSRGVRTLSRGSHEDGNCNCKSGSQGGNLGGGGGGGQDGKSRESERL